MRVIGQVVVAALVCTPGCGLFAPFNSPAPARPKSYCSPQGPEIPEGADTNVFCRAAAERLAAEQAAALAQPGTFEALLGTIAPLADKGDLLSLYFGQCAGESNEFENRRCLDLRDGIRAKANGSVQVAWAPESEITVGPYDFNAQEFAIDFTGVLGNVFYRPERAEPRRRFDLPIGWRPPKSAFNMYGGQLAYLTIGTPVAATAERLTATTVRGKMRVTDVDAAERIRVSSKLVQFIVRIGQPWEFEAMIDHVFPGEPPAKVRFGGISSEVLAFRIVDARGFILYSEPRSGGTTLGPDQRMPGAWELYKGPNGF